MLVGPSDRVPPILKEMNLGEWDEGGGGGERVLGFKWMDWGCIIEREWGKVSSLACIGILADRVRMAKTGGLRTGKMMA